MELDYIALIIFGLSYAVGTVLMTPVVVLLVVQEPDYWLTWVLFSAAFMWSIISATMIVMKLNKDEVYHEYHKND